MNNKDTLQIICALKLNKFLIDRKERFKKIPPKKRTEWANKIANQIWHELSDNDIFYENMPKGIKEYN